MSLNNQDFAQYLQQKLGFTDAQVSTKPLRKLAQQKAQKLIKGKSTITYGGKVILLSPKKKIDANTFGGTNQFKPVLPTTDFMRVYLARNTSSIPEFIVIDLDDDNIKQFKNLVELIPEAKNTLVLRTSKANKYHVWFKYPQPSPEQIKNVDYIVQTRTTKSSLLPGFNTDIFTTGVLFEGYLTNRMLNNSIREPKDYTKCVVYDNSIQELSQQSVAIIKGSVDNSRAKRSLGRGTGYLVYSDQTLASTILKYISAIDIVDEYSDTTKDTHISVADIMYIYNSIFNPADYISEDSNPFLVEDEEINTKKISVYNYDSGKVITKLLSKLPQRPSVITSLNMPVPQGNWDYYNNIALKVHSQCYLTFDDRQAFIEKWLTRFVIPASAKKLSLVVWREMFWDEFSPGDIPYKEAYSISNVADKPQTLDDFVLGDFSLNGKWLYIPTLYMKSGISKRVLVQVNIDTEKLKASYSDDIIYRSIDEVADELEAVTVEAKKAEVKGLISKDTIRGIREDIKAWVTAMTALASNSTVEIVSRFMFSKYDTLWWDDARGYPVFNTLVVPNTFKINKYSNNIVSKVTDNILWKQIHMTLGSTETMRTPSSKILKLADGTHVTHSIYYCLMLAHTLFNRHAPLGRFVMYGEGRTGKTRLSLTIPILLFSDTLVQVISENTLASSFTPDYENLRCISLNEINYDTMSNREKKKFDGVLKTISAVNERSDKNMKNSNDKDQLVDVLTLESTNHLPYIAQDDTRVIVVKATKSLNSKAVEEVHVGIDKLTSESQEVVDFAEYLYYLYTEHILHVTDIYLALTLSVPSTDTKILLQSSSVNNTERLHDILLVNGDFTSLEDMRDGTDILDNRIDYLLNRKPIIYREDINRVIIHMDDLRLLYWILGKKEEIAYADGLDSEALDPDHDDYGKFTLTGKGINKGMIKNALKAEKLYAIDIYAEDKNNHIIELYDSLTGLKEMSTVTDKKRLSNYIGIAPMSGLKAKIQAGYACNVSLLKTIEGS